MNTARIGEKHFTASALIENEGRFFVQYHTKLQKWLYPGGHIEANEEPQDALLREIEEETDLAVSIVSCADGMEIQLALDEVEVEELPVPFVVLCEKIAGPGHSSHWHIDLVYVCELDRQRTQNSVDRPNCRWVTPEEMTTLDCPSELPSLMSRAAQVLKRRRAAAMRQRSN